MTTIILPPDIEGPLTEQARQRGTTPEQLVLDSLRMLFVPATTDPETEEGTLYDYLSGYIGVISGSSVALSENGGAHFTEGLIEKQAQGHL
jgi:hypothetical protein